MAFENVELRDRFTEDESWIYGITPEIPGALIEGAPRCLLGVDGLLAGPR